MKKLLRIILVIVTLGFYGFGEVAEIKRDKITIEFDD